MCEITAEAWNSSIKRGRITQRLVQIHWPQQRKRGYKFDRDWQFGLGKLLFKTSSNERAQANQSRNESDIDHASVGSQAGCNSVKKVDWEFAEKSDWREKSGSSSSCWKEVPNTEKTYMNSDCWGNWARKRKWWNGEGWWHWLRRCSEWQESQWDERRGKWIWDVWSFVFEVRSDVNLYVLCLICRCVRVCLICLFWVLKRWLCVFGDYHHREGMLVKSGSVNLSD
jgi:hypothetical protein